MPVLLEGAVVTRTEIVQYIYSSHRPRAFERAIARRPTNRKYERATAWIREDEKCKKA